MKQILIILFISTLLPARLQAQRAYKEGTKIIFDLTVAAGMPAGAVTNVKKYTGTFTPRQDELGPNNDESSSINATVYHKLEIAPRDVNTLGNLDNTGTLTMPWVDAFNTCKSLTYDGGGWRLPTQRELMLMFMFLPAFNTFLNDGSIYNGTPLLMSTIGARRSTVTINLGHGLSTSPEVTPIRSSRRTIICSG